MKILLGLGEAGLVPQGASGEVLQGGAGKVLQAPALRDHWVLWPCLGTVVCLTWSLQDGLAEHAHHVGRRGVGNPHGEANLVENL